MHLLIYLYQIHQNIPAYLKSEKKELKLYYAFTELNQNNDVYSKFNKYDDWSDDPFMKFIHRALEKKCTNTKRLYNDKESNQNKYAMDLVLGRFRVDTTLDQKSKIIGEPITFVYKDAPNNNSYEYNDYFESLIKEMEIAINNVFIKFMTIGNDFF